jgi:NAD(P)-dependent dehydrogenase (short-subunit alcohol dehydrogenase family)
MQDLFTVNRQMVISEKKAMLPPALKIFSLEGKTAVITGPGTGLGRQMAIGLAMAGAEVMLVARREELLKKLTDELRDFPVDFCVADVSETDSVKAMVAATLKRFGKIDILVNNAATTHRSPIVEFDEEDFDRVIKINMRSCYLCMKYVGEVMIKAGRGGSVINIGSYAAHFGSPNSSAYAASKGGMLQLTRTAALEWASHNIRANIINPGTFKGTGLLEKCAKEDPTYGERFVKKFPLGRFGEPEEIVGACIYLASDNSTFITGEMINIAGGAGI